MTSIWTMGCDGSRRPCHKQGRSDVPIIVSRRARSRRGVEWRAPTGSADAGREIRRGSTPSRRRIRPLARSRDATDRRPPARARNRDRSRVSTGRFTGADCAAAEEFRRSRRRRSARRWRLRVPAGPEGVPSASCAGGAASEPKSAHQPVRSAPLRWCSMNSTPSSRQRQKGDSRLAGTTRDVARSRSRDERNCAQWFARFEERRAEPTGRPSQSEVRRLRKELEALRRLVTGEQIQ